MKKKSGMLVFAFVAGLSGVSFGKASMSNISWKMLDGTYDGVVTNAAHWTGGVVPGARKRLYFNSIASDFTLSFPKDGSFVSPANMYLSAGDGYTVVVDGRDSHWAIDGSPDGTEVHDDNPFQLLGAGYGLMGLYLGTAAAYTNAVAEMSNFCFVVEGSASNPRLVVDGGSYDFRNPLESTAYDAAAATKRPILQVGYGHATETTEVVFRNGASVRAWNFGPQACAPMNTVVFDGAYGYFQAMNMPNGSIDYYNLLANRSDVVLTNGAKVSVNSLAFGHRANKDVRLILSGEGTEFETRGNFTGADTSRMSVLDVRDGARLRVGGQMSMTCNKGTNYTTVAGGHVSLEGSSAEFGACAADRLPQQFCRLTATGGSINYCVAGKTLKFDGNTSVWTSNTTWNASNLSLGPKGNGGRPSFEMHGGDVDVTNILDVAASDSADLTVDGGTLTSWYWIRVGLASGATGVVNVASGSLVNDHAAKETPVGQANCLYLANAAGSYGIFNLSGGEASLFSFFAAWFSHAEVNVSGGRLRIRNDLRLGNGRTSDGAYDVFTQTGGEVDCRYSDPAEIGEASPSRARLRLLGGVFKANGLKGGAAAAARGGSGRAELVADGGTLAAKSACTVLSKFDDALIDEGGLTIDTQGFDVTIDQDLHGTGVLTLTGGGRVTFASGVSCGVAVKVTGGTAVDFNGVSPAGLVLGDENGSATLAVAVGGTVAVDGDIVLNDFALAVSGTMEKNVDYAPFLTCTGAFDAASQEKWADSILGASVSPEYSEVFSWSESGGTTSLSAKKTDKVVRLVEVKEGVSNIVEDVLTRRTENLEVAVSNGAVCGISGRLAKGRVDKTGEGRLELSGADNLFLGGFGVFGGLLRIATAGALGDGSSTEPCSFGAGTFEVAASAGHVTLANSSTLAPDPATNAVIFKTEGDLTMPLPLGTSTGAVIKRGAGRLTFTCDWDKTKKNVWSAGNPPSGQGTAWAFPTNPEAVAFDDEQGNLPASARYGVVNVAEGELVLRSVGERSSVEFTSGPIYVGYPTSSRSASGAQPALVLDNVSCTFSGSHVHLGESYSGVNPWVVEPKIIVTNHAYLAANTLHLTDFYADNGSCSPLLYVNGGTVSVTYRFEPHYSNNANIVPRGVFVDSRLYAGYTDLRGHDLMCFTNSMLAANSSTNAVTMELIDNAYVHDWRFSSGSVLSLASLKVRDTVTPNKQVKFTFDDSQWIPGSSLSAFSGIFTSADRAGALDVVSKGRGLVLAPQEGVTWTFDLPLGGDGGFVKRGAGTVVFGGSFAGHGGRTVVEEGVLDLGGTTWDGRTFAGGDGVVSNGTLRATRVALEVSDDGEAWEARSTPFFADCSFSGRTVVDLGRGDGDPLSTPYKSLVVARYAGVAPDVSSWRLVGTGIPRTGGTFAAEGGVVRATACAASGAFMVIR